ncbi:MAG TPA: Uma2 family endonuclease [Acidothermaceae bacterium]|nr:Uma2 family endonuclease [Acidothermaceae bacterium]
MGAMTVTGLPFGRPLTIDDLESMPDDGHRYELLDGMLLVSPAPGWSHQDVVGRMYLALMAACTAGHRVLLTPFAVTFGTRDTELQPDVLVARYGDLSAKNLPAAPVLAVEVRSPSTALVDLNLKKAAYERFGVESYWIVDPETPSFIAYELTERGYAEVARAGGDEVAEITRPFAVRISPAELRRGLEPD